MYLNAEHCKDSTAAEEHEMGRAFVLVDLGTSFITWRKTMKNRYTSLVFSLVVIAAVITTGCPQPKTTTGNMNCSYNTQTGAYICQIGITVVYDRNAQMEQGSKLIVDVPNGWSSNFSNAELGFVANYGETEAANVNIPLEVTTTDVSPVASGSSVHAFIGDGTSIATADAAHESENESRYTSQITLTQNNCMLSPGEYTTHFRTEDSTGIAYIGAVTIIYDAPNEGSCVGSSATLK